MTAAHTVEQLLSKARPKAARQFLAACKANAAAAADARAAQLRRLNRLNWRNRAVKQKLARVVLMGLLGNKRVLAGRVRR